MARGPCCLPPGGGHGWSSRRVTRYLGSWTPDPDLAVVLQRRKSQCPVSMHGSSLSVRTSVFDRHLREPTFVASISAHAHPTTGCHLETSVRYNISAQEKGLLAGQGHATDSRGSTLSIALSKLRLSHIRPNRASHSQFWCVTVDSHPSRECIYIVALVKSTDLSAVCSLCLRTCSMAHSSIMHLRITATGLIGVNGT